MENETKTDPRDDWIESNSGNWLKTDKVQELEKQGLPIGIILSEPQLVDKEFTNKEKEITKYKRLEMEIEINKEAYIFDMTQRDAKDCKERWGEYNNWIGKLLYFTTTKTNVGRSILAKPYQQPVTPTEQPAKAGSGGANTTCFYMNKCLQNDPLIKDLSINILGETGSGMSHHSINTSSEEFDTIEGEQSPSTYTDSSKSDRNKNVPISTSEHRLPKSDGVPLVPLFLQKRIGEEK